MSIYQLLSPAYPVDVDTGDLRTAKLRALIALEPTIADFCRKYDLNATYISQLINGHRAFGEKAARKIETKLHKPRGWLDSEDGSGIATLIIRDTPTLDAMRFNARERAEIAARIRDRMGKCDLSYTGLAKALGVSADDASHIAEHGTDNLIVLKKVVDALNKNKGPNEQRESLDYLLWGLSAAVAPVDPQSPAGKAIEAARARVKRKA